MIVRRGLAELHGVLDELSISRPLLISTERWHHLQLPVHDRFHGARAHAEIAGIKAAREAAGGVDGLVALGGGSAIDTAKAVSSQTGLPVVSVPTTYSGAEWTSGYGLRDRSARRKLGGGGARTVAIVYEVELTLGQPARESADTAMNALAHCAEALYTTGRAQETDAGALAGAPLVTRWLPVVAGNGHDLQARRGLLEGAMHAGAALRAGTGLGHAIALALGGRYGLPHGTMNAVTLPAALRFNSTVAAGELARFGEAIGSGDSITRVSELAALAGPSRLRDYAVPGRTCPSWRRRPWSSRRSGRTHARRRRTQCSNYWRRCGDQNRSQMDESTPILTTSRTGELRHPRRWQLTPATKGEPTWERSS